ncbi:hypothetical protein ACFXPZ_15205, partial [Streptomyces sp. NPDC059101]
MANFAKSRVPRFTVEVHHNPFLPQGGRTLHAVVAVTATGGGSTGGRPVPGPRPDPAVAGPGRGAPGGPRGRAAARRVGGGGGGAPGGRGWVGGAE